jgi:hypothetical protein
MAPRPILKTLRRASGGPNLLVSALPFSSSSSTLFSPHVHFPPTPTLTATFTAHSSDVYDRKPILVSPNECTLPERDERVYLELPSAPHCIQPSTERRPRSHAVKPIGSYFHPRAYEACEKDKVIVDDDVFLSSSDSSDSDMSPPSSPPELTVSSSSASEVSDSDWSPRMPSPRIPLPLRLPVSKPHQSSPPQTLSRSSLMFLPHPGGMASNDTLDTPAQSASRITQMKKRRSEKLFSQRRGANEAVGRRPLLDDGCLGGF